MPTFEEIKNIAVVLGGFLLAGALTLIPDIPLELKSAAIIGAFALAANYQGSRFTAKGIMQSVETLQPFVGEVVSDARKLSPQANAVIATIQAGQYPTIEQLTAIQPDLVQLLKDAEMAAKVGLAGIEKPEVVTDGRT